MLADASVPRCPTMAASMKNIMTLVICASIDGMLSPTMRLSLSRNVNGCPLRMLANNASLFVIQDAKLLIICKQKIAAAKHSHLLTYGQAVCFSLTITKKFGD